MTNPRPLSPIERRVLAYLDQRDARHRSLLVQDLASPDSRIGRGVLNGSNAAIPLIAGKWCKRLLDEGLVRVVTDSWGCYRAHEITAAGREVLRA